MLQSETGGGGGYDITRAMSGLQAYPSAGSRFITGGGFLQQNQPAVISSAPVVSGGGIGGGGGGGQTWGEYSPPSFEVPSFNYGIPEFKGTDFGGSTSESLGNLAVLAGIALVGVIIALFLGRKKPAKKK